MFENQNAFITIEGKKYKSKLNEDGALIITKAMQKALHPDEMKENKSNFYFGYPGNKRSENKLLEPYLKLDDIDKIIEPFCGTSSFSRFIYANYGDKYTYYSNDIDTGLINWLNDVKIYGCKKYFDYTNARLKGLT